MNVWIIALLVATAVYVIGVVGFYLWLPDSPARVVLAVAWPATAIWMLIGNIQ